MAQLQTAQPTTSSTDSSSKQGLSDNDLKKLSKTISKKVLNNELSKRSNARSSDSSVLEHPVDCLVATDKDPQTPDDIFNRLRWGGALIFISKDKKLVDTLAQEYNHYDNYDSKVNRGFFLEKAPAAIASGLFGLPFFGTKAHYFIARRTHLIQPGDMTDRFTYSVCLLRAPDEPFGYVVKKTVPQRNYLFWRLRQKYTQDQVNDDDLLKRTNKLVDKVFPTFITREAGFLMKLHDHLPEKYRCRVPRAVKVEKDKDGFVRELHMNWLRNTCQPISQLQFAKQSTELLKALHETVNIMHLDLRLDNMVITDDGVGFVDFGSAARIGEKLERNEMLGSLFNEMMRTSQIQRTLGAMLEKGHVTSQLMHSIHGKADKAVDLFYLSVQINQTQSHPTLHNLVTVDKNSSVAKQLKQLTDRILRPEDPDNPDYKTADDMLKGVMKVK